MKAIIFLRSFERTGFFLFQYIRNSKSVRRILHISLSRPQGWKGGCRVQLRLGTRHWLGGPQGPPLTFRRVSGPPVFIFIVLKCDFMKDL